MKKIYYLIFAAVSIFCTACPKKNSEYCHYSILFMNDTNKELLVFYDPAYPDTMNFANAGGYILNDINRKVAANTLNNKALRDRWDCWETNFKSKHYLLSDTLMVFVLDLQVVESNPWMDIYNNYMVLRRYDLSLADLQCLNWIITYPPTEAMKDMKMYPPYGE